VGNLPDFGPFGTECGREKIFEKVFKKIIFAVKICSEKFLPSFKLKGQPLGF
jgi:hypothetical protein